MRLHFTSLAALTLSVCTIASAEEIWIEGEKPASQQVTRHPFWYDKVKAGELSGGDWISNWSEQKQGTLSYSFDVKEAGEHTFWLRANPTGTSLFWKLNGGPEQQVSFAGQLDNRNVAEDNAIDLRFLAWVKVGKVPLVAGRNTLEFRMASDNNNHGAIDCMLLTTAAFIPEGSRKPGEGGGVANAVSEEGHWPFVVPEDAYKPDALLDLTSLNEKQSGATGLIRLSQDGMSFVRGDGQPIRFWGVVSGGVQMNPDDMEEHCRWLAKRGVNMVRLHLTVCDTKEGAKITDVNEKELDGIFRMVAAAKKHGIYVTLSPFWASATAPKSWELEDYGGKPVWGVMFFNDKLKDAYKTWTKELYTRVNPYTGIALKDDPTMAIIQVKNEDSLLFWTFSAIEGAQRRLLEKRFGDWAAAKYGSVEKALAEYKDQQNGDDVAGGRLGFINMWHMTSQAPRMDNARIKDQTQFLGQLQYDFYADIVKHYRSLGCKQLINAMNWRSADQVLLDDMERWTYTATDVLAVNYYTGGMHTGENNGWRIDPGHHLKSESVLTHPNSFPMNLKQAVGHPMLITETSWTDPAMYQTEGPFMACAYQSLTGVDCTYWFAYGNPGYESDPRYTFLKHPNGYSLHKWSGNTPQQAGMFPAFALAFRKGYIKQAAEPVVYEERSLDDMFSRRVPIISESGRFDPNRDTGAFAKESPVKQEVDRLAFYVGPVHVKFAGDAKNNRVADLSKYIDRDKGVVRSITDEVSLDYKNGVCSVNAPAIQGVSGFLKASGGRFQMADVQITSDNEYATIAAVSLDEQPLKTSHKLLIQVGTTSKTTGWSTRKATFKAEDQQIEGEEIVRTGTAPWQIAQTRATITIANQSLTKATLLDVNGYPTEKVELQQQGGKAVIALPPNAMYVVVEQ